ncbi:MAG: hypothetical protein U0234_01045 [Sandaracinus sp.]
MSASDWPHADSVGAEEEDPVDDAVDEAVVLGGGDAVELLDELELPVDELDEDDEPLDDDESSPGSGSREPGGLVRSREELDPLLESSPVESLPVELLPPDPVEDPLDELPPLQPLAETAPASAITSASRTRERPQEGITMIMVHPHWPAPAAAGPGRAASTTPCDPHARA